MRPQRRDTGSISAEAVIALPVLMLTILAGMQVALLFFARVVALASAQEGVRAARGWHSSHAGAASVAQTYAQRTGGGFLRSVTATAATNATTIRVHIRGQALSLVPFLKSIEVNVTAAGPVERWTTDTGGFANSEGSFVGNSREVAPGG